MLSHQGVLEKIARTIFEGEHVLPKVRKEAHLINANTGLHLEVDVWIPTKQLGFEFQDMYHYTTTWYSQLSHSTIYTKDNIKHELLRAKGETLIIVPFWWEGDYESLMATVIFQRPELQPRVENFLPIDSPCIPLNPSLGQVDDFSVPGIGELMLASFPESNTIFEQSISVQNCWWMGEKYDGVRFCWHPALHRMFRKSSKELDLPYKFTHFYGSKFLDGEIWFGRNCFSEAVQVIALDWSNVNWPFFRNVVFDVPDPELNDEPFETRFSALLEWIDPENPLIIVASRVLCMDKAFLSTFTQQIIKDEGEGVVLRRPGSYYLHGRSDSLFKFKSEMSDMEALVIDIDNPSHPTLKLPNGSIIKAEAPEKSGIHLGDIVTFAFERKGTLAGPAQPQVLRVRKDISWEEVIKNSDPSVQFSIPKTNIQRQSERKFRLFLENFASNNSFDPLFAEHWYTVSRGELANEVGMREMLSHYNGSLIEALVKSLPEIKFDKTKFSFVEMNHWDDPENRKKFFLKFAKMKHFDPLVAENWYKFRYTDYYNSLKKFTTVMQYYPKGVGQALLHLFPNIGLDKEKLPKYKYYWANEGNQRKVLTDFAKGKGFDHLVAENWYIHSWRGSEGFQSVMSHYPGGMRQALLRLFPNIKMNKQKLPKSKNYWANEENRKRFFVEVAKEKGFDPLCAGNWYSYSWKDMYSSKGFLSVISYYSGGLGHALFRLFPNIGLDKEKLPKYVERNFGIKECRRIFFLEFAKSKKFDPLVAQNWYSYRNSDFLNLEGGEFIHKFYQKNAQQALLKLFPGIGLERFKFSKN